MTASSAIIIGNNSMDNNKVAVRIPQSNGIYKTLISSKHVDQGWANYGPSHHLEHSHTCLFICCLYLLSHSNSKVE